MKKAGNTWLFEKADTGACGLLNHPRNRRSIEGPKINNKETYKIGEDIENEDK